MRKTFKVIMFVVTMAMAIYAVCNWVNIDTFYRNVFNIDLGYSDTICCVSLLTLEYFANECFGKKTEKED